MVILLSIESSVTISNVVITVTLLWHLLQQKVCFSRFHNSSQLTFSNEIIFTGQLFEGFQNVLITRTFRTNSSHVTQEFIEFNEAILVSINNSKDLFNFLIINIFTQ